MYHWPCQLLLLLFPLPGFRMENRAEEEVCRRRKGWTRAAVSELQPCGSRSGDRCFPPPDDPHLPFCRRVKLQLPLQPPVLLWPATFWFCCSSNLCTWCSGQAQLTMGTVVVVLSLLPGRTNSTSHIRELFWSLEIAELEHQTHCRALLPLLNSLLPFPFKSRE